LSWSCQIIVCRGWKMLCSFCGRKQKISCRKHLPLFL
jgi:Fe2+ transport system protein B